MWGQYDWYLLYTKYQLHLHYATLQDSRFVQTLKCTGIWTVANMQLFQLEITTWAYFLFLHMKKVPSSTFLFLFWRDPSTTCTDRHDSKHATRRNTCFDMVVAILLSAHKQRCWMCQQHYFVVKICCIFWVTLLKLRGSVAATDRFRQFVMIFNDMKYLLIVIG
jgi:hypothetical protein